MIGSDKQYRLSALSGIPNPIIDPVRR